MKDWLNYWILFIVLASVAAHTNYFESFVWSEIISGLFFNLLIWVLPVWLVAKWERRSKKPTTGD